MQIKPRSSLQPSPCRWRSWSLDSHSFGSRVRSVVVLICLLLPLHGTLLSAADRTTLFLPLSQDSSGSDLAKNALFPDAAFGGRASLGWQAYLQLWHAHHADPSNASIRRFLGLPLTKSFEASAKRGRTAPSWLRWRPGTFAQVETPHFTIYSRANEQSSKQVAEDLERCYWVWTQMFFPLWEANAQVNGAFRDWKPGQDIAEYLEGRSQRITVRRRLRVVLFRDADEYRKTLGPENPGIERSTGFYNDQRQTTFLYADETDDAATRRHEMVHQLFREATRSGLGRGMPGEASGFWLIEGIAGYFESLYLGDQVATVGGWDAPRMQFARYRVLVGGDVMPMAELEQDGWEAAQQRSDLARWYAHAILRTHQLMDGDKPGQRQWLYMQLAERYRIKTGDSMDAPPVDRNQLDQQLRAFLAIDDQHLKDNPVTHGLSQLCLAGCDVTEQGIAGIPASPELRWLDLARLPVGNTEVQRLAPNPETMEQLTLEVTRIDQNLVPWLKRARRLREVDLSWTRSDDSAIDALDEARGISTLWMTGTRLTDNSIASIVKMKQLESVDLQRTGVSESGIQRLKTIRPQLEINPLELRTQ